MKRRLLFLFVLLALSAILLTACADTPDETVPASTTPAEATSTPDTTTQEKGDDPVETTTKKVRYPENPTASAVHVNQLGYMPNAQKRAIVAGGGREFWVVNADTGEVVHIGKVTASRRSDEDKYSGEVVCYADFTEFTQTGRYYLAIDGTLFSYPFEIKEDVYADLLKGTLHAYYYQRCGTSLSSEHAGDFAHGICHNYSCKIWQGWDYKGTLESKKVSKGWHDAGDFSRWPITGATGVMSMFSAYMLTPELFGDDTNIPESSNGIPDILDEARWEIEFILDMQAESGGFYHFIFPEFHASIDKFPHEDFQPYYIYPVGYESTGSSVATLAWAYRVYKDIDAEFANECLDAAKRGQAYLEANPEDRCYGENEYTNGYGSPVASKGKSTYSHRFAAALQMYLTTCDSHYQNLANEYIKKLNSVENYFNGDHDSYAYLAYRFDTTSSAERDEALLKKIENRLKEHTANMAYNASLNGYNLALDIFWRLTNVYMTRNCIQLAVAMLIDDEVDYTDIIQSNIDYLLGQNPLDLVYFTGYGYNSVRNLHHRMGPLSGRKALPPPGFMVFGAGSYEYSLEVYAKLPEFIPEGTPPMKCYIQTDAMNHIMTEFQVGTMGNPLLMLSLYEKLMDRK